MMGEETDIRVALARIEGKQDVTNERLETANRINDERHSAMKAHLHTIDLRLIAHSSRISSLESTRTGGEGERRGMLLSGKIMWTLTGAIPIGIGALLLRVFGA